MLVEVQPRQATVAPDMPLGRGVFRVIEGGDGHIDALWAELRDQRDLRPTGWAEISHATRGRVVPRWRPAQPGKVCCGHGDPSGDNAATDSPANRTMAMCDVVQRPAELIAQVSAVAAAGVNLPHSMPPR